MRALILQTFPFHYECLGSLFYHLCPRVDDLDVCLPYTQEAQSWYRVFSRFQTCRVNFISMILHDYDFAVIVTQHDVSAVERLTQLSCKLYCIHHSTSGCSWLESRKFCTINQGVEGYGNKRFHSMVYPYFRPEDKMLSSEVSIAVIGDVVRTEPGFFDHPILQNHRVLVINRFPFVAPAHVEKHVAIDAETIMELLRSCHYVYYVAPQRVTWGRATGSIPLAISCLCRVICLPVTKKAFGLLTAMTTDGDHVPDVLPALTPEIMKDMVRERESFLYSTRHTFDEFLS